GLLGAGADPGRRAGLRHRDTQVTIFAIQIALGELLRHHGAKPAAVIGQSLGEAASAYFAGGLSLRDATRAICSRSHLMGEGEAMPWVK
ncbi:acyltransferase domain-containing protein, partial [Escherichia coli]|nr:acyltransferase domain-containing protein [Escherichia coli]